MSRWNSQHSEFLFPPHREKNSKQSDLVIPNVFQRWYRQTFKREISVNEQINSHIYQKTEKTKQVETQENFAMLQGFQIFYLFIFWGCQCVIEMDGSLSYWWIKSGKNIGFFNGWVDEGWICCNKVVDLNLPSKNFFQFPVSVGVVSNPCKSQNQFVFAFYIFINPKVPI